MVSDQRVGRGDGRDIRKMRKRIVTNARSFARQINGLSGCSDAASSLRVTAGNNAASIKQVCHNAHVVTSDCQQSVDIIGDAAVVGGVVL